MLLGLGDNCLDLYVDLGEGYPGGNAVNVAVFARALGLEAHYAGRVGDDDHGRFLLREIAAAGVGVDTCRVEPGEATAWTRIGLTQGERVFLGVHFGPAGPFTLDEAQLRLAHRARVIHLSAYSGLPALQVERVRGHGRLLSYDCATRGLDEAARSILPLVDIAFVSMPFTSEDEHLARAREVAALGPRTVVLAHGERGATFLHEGRTWSQGITPARVVDTLGAGDAFIARILCGFFHEEPLREAGLAASAFAARICERRGAFGSPLALASPDIADTHQQGKAAP